MRYRSVKQRDIRLILSFGPEQLEGWCCRQPRQGRLWEEQETCEWGTDQILNSWKICRDREFLSSTSSPWPAGEGICAGGQVPREVEASACPASVLLLGWWAGSGRGMPQVDRLAFCRLTSWAWSHGGHLNPGLWIWGGSHLKANTRIPRFLESRQKGRRGSFLWEGAGCVRGKKAGLSVGFGFWMTVTLSFFWMYVVIYLSFFFFTTVNSL